MVSYWGALGHDLGRRAILGTTYNVTVYSGYRLTPRRPSARSVTIVV